MRPEAHASGEGNQATVKNSTRAWPKTRSDEKQGQNRENAAVYARHHSISRLRFGTAHDELNFARIFRSGAEERGFELHVARGALESRVGAALEPAWFHDIENRRGKPARIAFLCVLDIEPAQAAIQLLAASVTMAPEPA